MSGYANGTWHPHWLMGSDNVIVYHEQSLLYRSGRICLDFFSTIFPQQKTIIWIKEGIKKCVPVTIYQNTSLGLELNSSNFLHDVYHNRQRVNELTIAC